MQYTKQELEQAVMQSKSLTHLIKDVLKLNYSIHYRAVIKAYIIKYGLSIDHWDRVYDKSCSLDYSKCYNAKLNSGSLRRLTLQHYKKPYICEKCGCDGVWLGEKITLDIHHIDGNRANNLKENLQILCPNCHAQTSSYKKRKYDNNVTKTHKIYQKTNVLKQSSRQHKCLDCDNLVFEKKIKRCADCANIARRRVIRPNKEQLILDLKELPMTKVGIKYGVTDNAIRRWANKYQIELTVKTTSSTGKEMNHG